MALSVPCLATTVIAGLMMSACCSTASVTPIEVKPVVPAMCSVMCPEMPATNESKIEAIRELRAWGQDCRNRQAECVGWIGVK